MRARNGLSAISASAAATKFSTAAAMNTECQPLALAPITLLSGTRSAAVPFAV